MKKIFILLNLISALSFGASAVVIAPSAMQPLVSLDTSTAVLTSSFAGPNAAFVSSLTGISRVCFINGLSVAILGSMNASSCTAGTVANFVVPASNGTLCLDAAKNSGAICLKTRTGTIGSGIIDGMIW